MRDMDEAVAALRLAAAEMNELTANAYFRWQRHSSHPTVAEILELFGSWQIALERAGVGGQRIAYSKVEVIEALRAAKEELDPFTSVTYRDWAREHEAPSLTDIVHHFNSWQQALFEADILKERTQQMEHKIIQSLLEAHSTLPLLTSQTYTKWAIRHNRPTVATIARRYGSWTNALEIIGIEPPRKRWGEEDVLFVLVEAEAEVGPLSIVKYQAWAEGREVPSVGTINALFGGWRTALATLDQFRKEA
ncbi:hypothetical protein [Exiguobacterium flavidum]|uniref:hypothetical protein n=1 Tax=Exiguobacterium flavidum TaxID=2184695 RepID=UPI000DF84D4A|nr:hypothetical protein [Exiguobacterium flavidum]